MLLCNFVLRLSPRRSHCWLLLCLCSLLFLLVEFGHPPNSSAAAPLATPAPLPTYTWQLFNYIGFGVYWIAFSPTYTIDQTIYLATGEGVQRSTNGGTLWQPFNTGLPSVQRLDFSPAYATDHRLFVGTVAGIYVTTDDGQHWTNLGVNSEVVTGIAISPDFANDQSIFVGTGSGRVYRSTNGGGAWQVSGPLYQDYMIRGLVISPNFNNDATVFAGVGKADQWYSGGVYRSINGGQTWQTVNNGLTYQEVGALAISPNYARDQTLFVTVWFGGCSVLPTAAIVGVP